MKVGQRIKLTALGKLSCSPEPIRKFPEDYIFKGTITEILKLSSIGTYVVRMDNEGFECFSHGKGFNTFNDEDLEAI